MSPAEMFDGFGLDPERGAWCPRRLETGSTLHMPDTWRVDRGYLSCSYCGSGHPDNLMAAIRADSVVLGPTDKNYKLYLEQPRDALPRVGSKFYLQHLSADQRREFVELYNDREIRRYGDALDFTVERAGLMKFGFPGYLYAGAFFMTGA